MTIIIIIIKLMMLVMVTMTTRWTWVGRLWWSVRWTTCAATRWDLIRNIELNVDDFLATLVALHYTPGRSKWAEFQTSVALRLASLFDQVGWLKAGDQTILALHKRVITHNTRFFGMISHNCDSTRKFGNTSPTTPGSLKWFLLIEIFAKPQEDLGTHHPQHQVLWQDFTKLQYF